ncbi:hypothetical protein BLJ79_21670 [Arthrobacter sp. UCD-GKA]|uniref:putative phage holin n=1 Tax=Arthrobacter sp. UCD-GKA TaxID=1913576 RepID=UPI0008DDD2CD|nr:hypothetical protein [Arthrobacter sp. UCD-GKA]OIH81970.1 hypothetical protein BLJ79_21670 [Arthrobacter sp. UCD-GKA]
MTIQPLTGILMAVALTETVVVMIGWHRMTNGAWTGFPAGRVLMGLLGVLAAILTLATISSWLPGFPGRPWIYVGLYMSLIVVLGWLGWTIFREQHKRN